MTDILERYETLKLSSNPQDYLDFADDAAAEIRRLRQQVRELKEVGDRELWNYLGRQIDSARIEEKRRWNLISKFMKKESGAP